MRYAPPPPSRHADMRYAPPLPLHAGMAAAASVFYNYSGSVACLDPRAGVNPETDEDGDFWGYQYCTEMFMPFSRDGGRGGGGGDFWGCQYCRGVHALQQGWRWGDVVAGGWVGEMWWLGVGWGRCRGWGLGGG